MTDEAITGTIEDNHFEDEANKPSKRTIAKVERASTKSLSDRAKDRIERIANDHAEDLSEYLDTLENSTLQTFDGIPFSKIDEVKRLNDEIRELENQDEQITILKTEKLKAVLDVIQEQYGKRVRKVEEILARVKEKRGMAESAGKIQVEKEFSDKVLATKDKIDELKQKLQQLKIQEQAEKVLRETAFKHSVSKLQGELQDRKRKVITRLWTAVHTSDDVTNVLDELPEPLSFRNHVTPELFCRVFNEFIDTNKQLIDTSKLKCKFCGSSKLEVYSYSTSTTMNCNECHKRDVVDLDNSIKILALPALQDIIDEKNKQCQSNGSSERQDTHTGNGEVDSTQKALPDSNSLNITQANSTQ